MGKEEDCNSQRVIDSMKCMESIENDHCEGVGGFDSHEQQQEDDKQQQDEKHQLELSGASESEDIEDDLKYPGPLASFLIFLSIALAIFICGFDTNCVATIIPIVTDEFGSFNDVGWYGASYLLASASSQLFYGRIYKFFSAKLVFNMVVAFLGIGSLICALAPNSVTFIIGRAVSGLGSAGIFSGSNIILSRTVPLRRRPIMLSFIGALECVAITVGPLLGGTLARYIGWRWCFWICLPVVGVTLAVTTFFFRVDDAAEAQGLSWKQKLAQLDYTGAVFFLPGVICVILALQWGGSVYAWGNWRVILLLVLFAVLIGVFAFTQWRKGDDATVPPSVIGTRTVLLGSWYSFNTAGSLYVASYYLPIWFQTSKSLDPFESGVHGLPLVVSLIVSIILSGSITSIIGYCNPTMWLGTVLMAVGAGLLTTLKIDSSAAQWIIYQIVFSLGCGFGFQQPIIATQTAFSAEQLPSALVVVAFMQTLGGIIAVSVAQNIFSNRLVANLRSVAPDVDPSIIHDTGILDIKSQFSPEQLRTILPAYNRSITQVLTLGLAMACATVVGAAFIPWRSLKKKKVSESGGQ